MREHVYAPSEYEAVLRTGLSGFAHYAGETKLLVFGRDKFTWIQIAEIFGVTGRSRETVGSVTSKHRARKGLDMACDHDVGGVKRNTGLFGQTKGYGLPDCRSASTGRASGLGSNDLRVEQIRGGRRNSANSQSEHDAGRLVDAEEITTGEYLTRWLNNTAKNKVRAATWRRYKQLVELYLIPNVGGVKLSKLAPLHVEQCYAAMERGNDKRKPAGATTRRAAGTALSIALRHAVRVKLVPYNAAVADVAKARQSRT